MINLLKDGKNHSRLFKNFDIEINFSLGFCKSCKEKNYLRKDWFVYSSFLLATTLKRACVRLIIGTVELVEFLPE